MSIQGRVELDMVRDMSKDRVRLRLILEVSVAQKRETRDICCSHIRFEYQVAEKLASFAPQLPTSSNRPLQLWGCDFLACLARCILESSYHCRYFLLSASILLPMVLVQLLEERSQTTPVNLKLFGKMTFSVSADFPVTSNARLSAWSSCSGWLLISMKSHAV